MRLILVQAINFASYAELSFSFENEGLALITGPTGAGKSTIQDVVPWCLFALTAKDGNADEIRPWQHSDPTEVTLTLEVNNSVITVTRIRGTPKQNDFYWREESGDPIRGKDIYETQELLNARLGCDAYTYIASCYYNECNPASLFFSHSKAHERRELFESVVDLSFPSQLVESTLNDKKSVKNELIKIHEKLNKALGRHESLERTVSDTQMGQVRWENDQELKLKDLQKKNNLFVFAKDEQISKLLSQFNEFESIRNSSLEQLLKEKDQFHDYDGQSEVCETCQQPNKRVLDMRYKREQNARKFEALSQQENPYKAKIEAAKERENPYDMQISYEQRKTNPFIEQLQKYKNDVIKNKAEIDTLTQTKGSFETRFKSLAHIQELAAQMRAEMLHSSIHIIESDTNSLLDKYFDAELRVAFEVDEKDNLDVTICKSGYECSYRQLSKGQKGLLKLCFSVAVMKASSAKSGVHYNTLFFDESLDGLDAQLKVKAYALFEHLLNNHENVFVIDHSSELSNLFDNKFNVEMNGDCSTISRI